MRKLKIIEHISLDGVIQHSADSDDFPYSDWTAPHGRPAGRDANARRVWRGLRSASWPSHLRYLERGDIIPGESRHALPGAGRAALFDEALLCNFALLSRPTEEAISAKLTRATIDKKIAFWFRK
jgi:hypothetical protein